MSSSTSTARRSWSSSARPPRAASCWPSAATPPCTRSTARRTSHRATSAPAATTASITARVWTMAESFCTAGDVELCFETFGDPADPALLLVMGLGTQMLGWHEDFCTDLAGRGFHVIRYDNRDIGRSTILSSAPVPSVGQIVRRDKRAASYTLAEMAADGVGLLDHLEIERVHLVGVSMGGMIAQTIAARRPERVLSLTSIMSSTGSRWRGQPALKTYRQFLRPVSTDRATYIAQTAALFDIIGSPGFDRDHDDLRSLLGAMYDRGHDAGSVTRQLAAILASGDRTAELHR